jgi:hypothetical protein
MLERLDLEFGAPSDDEPRDGRCAESLEGDAEDADPLREVALGHRDRKDEDAQGREYPGRGY